jgi:hypothetical protein
MGGFGRAGEVKDRGERAPLRNIEMGGIFGFLPGVSGRDGLLYM